MNPEQIGLMNRAAAGKPAEKLIPDVITKFNIAGEICNNALRKVFQESHHGAYLYYVCLAADDQIREELSKVFKNKVDKGVAFPVCISLNNCVGHCSPVCTDKLVMKKGDIAKVECGVHIDGYIAVAAFTFRIDEDGKASHVFKGREGDVMTAVQQCTEACIKVMQPGNSTDVLKDIVDKFEKAYDARPIRGVCMHNVKRYVLDGDKVEVFRDTPDEDPTQKNIPPVMAVNDVFVMDLVMSSGEGEAKTLPSKTNVFYKMPGNTYQPTLPNARDFMAKVNDKFPVFPFPLRDMEDGNNVDQLAREGFREVYENQCIAPFPVLLVTPEEIVCHRKLVVLITQTGPKVISGLLPELTDVSELYFSDKKMEDPQVLKLMEKSLTKKKRGGKKKKKKTRASSAS